MMKEIIVKSSDLKEYIKPSLNIVVYDHAPLNVLYVSGDNVDGIPWEELIAQDNND